VDRANTSPHGPTSDSRASAREASIQPARQTTPVPLFLASAPDDAEADVDIIAIHGLDTKSPDTWIWKSQDCASTANPSEVNWLTDPGMLAAMAGPARIFTCDWPASLFLEQDSIQMTTKELARGLLLAVQSRLGKNEDRPIVFIASCLGGIILTQALVLAARQGSEYASLWSATRGIVFLATPFRGTAFQDIAAVSVFFLKGYANLAEKRVTQLLDTVKDSTPFLQELVADFTRIWLHRNQACHLAIFYETKKSNLLRKGLPPWLADRFKKPKLVSITILKYESLRRFSNILQLVDRASACLDIVSDPIALDQTHVLMNKFSDPNDLGYRAVAGRIGTILRRIRTNSVLDDADDWIRSRHYTAERLKIERISGQLLPMDQCYINLAIIEHRGDSQNLSKNEDAAPRSSPFSLATRLKIEAPEKTLQVNLPTLLDPRKRPDGHTINPRRILIRGRAGVGKTTLCKKMVHDFTRQMIWQGLFTRVLWVPLRRLKQRSYAEYNLRSLFVHIYFEQHPDGNQLAEELWRAIDAEGTSSGGTLFILDGLDEVSDLLDPAHAASSFLAGLLNWPNIITSRPHARLPAGVNPPDLELETIGFYPDQVDTYLEKSFASRDDTRRSIDRIQSFLQSHPLIQGLVRISIQLDALCFAWDEIRGESISETMTAVYIAIEQTLWKKDALRLEKTCEGQAVTEDIIRDSTPDEVGELVNAEIKLLEAFGFAGLFSDVIDFEPSHRSQIRKQTQPVAQSLLLEKTLPCLSFLRTSDPSSEYGKRSYHFLHLTFQEYFAARYFIYPTALTPYEPPRDGTQNHNVANSTG
jgi:hypothetical protein